MTPKLPLPRTRAEISLEETFLSRKPVRAYTNTPLTLEKVSQLLRSAQGITRLEVGKRTAPSARALYPLDTVLGSWQHIRRYPEFTGRSQVEVSTNWS